MNTGRMEEMIAEILNDYDNSINWVKETALIDDRLLDSFGIITLVAELEEVFEVEIDASEIIKENFNSVKALAAMISRLQEK